jgi:hypothetical protein
MFEPEVQAGIKVLTEKGINWRAAARSPFLNMAGAHACILGLAVGDYWKVRDQWDVTAEWMEAHGFLITQETFDNTNWDYCDAYRALADAWRNAAELVTA